MKILLTGGTGFVGSALSSRLAREGHEVTILVRPGERTGGGPAGTAFLEGDPARPGPWQDAVPGFDAAINLAGASIFSRWTERQKDLIRKSRLATTRHLVEAIGSAPQGFTLFSTSAVGFYGFHDDEVLTEESPPGDDFLATVAVDWEKEALHAARKASRVVLTRFGIVLGPKGGALGQMMPLFRMYLGGPIGSGRQWFSWVHLDDLTEAFLFLLSRREITGPVNLCAPEPVRNRDLARALGRALHRPSLLPAPAFAVRLVLGELGSVILKGQRVVPRRLLDAGFTFRYPRIEEALVNIAGR